MQRVRAKQHHQAAHHLDGVADEHDFALGQASANAPTKRRQHHIEQRKHGHQGGALPLGAPPVRSNSTAATKSALSASELKNCADMMV
jgi:hypothetical protein